MPTQLTGLFGLGKTSLARQEKILISQAWMPLDAWQRLLIQELLRQLGSSFIRRILGIKM